VSGTFATKNTMRQGRSVSVEIAPADDAAALTRRCAAVFAGAGWRGPLNVQCQRDADGTLMIYEFNGRCTGATAARRWLGFDEVALLLRDWLDHGLPAATVPAAASVVRASFERLVEPDKVDRLQRDGFWHASTP
jgi:carbamoyl-phosphate synthase large subunit